MKRREARRVVPGIPLVTRTKLLGGVVAAPLASCGGRMRRTAKA